MIPVERTDFVSVPVTDLEGSTALVPRHARPGADDGAPGERLCASVREPNLAGVSEGADARLGPKLVAQIQRFSPLTRMRR